MLIAGCSADVPAIGALLAQLPPATYGQVYVEVASPVQIRRWPAPDGVVVTWLRRDLDRRALSTVFPKGELLARAVAAWMSEWLPDEAPLIPGLVWLGGATSSLLNPLHDELRRRLGPVHPGPAAAED